MLLEISTNLLLGYDKIHEKREVKLSDSNVMRVNLDADTLKHLEVTRDVFVTISPVFG
jgi:hypothetical protein